MNVAVITRHAVPNYGSLLQAYATQRAIEALGHRCEIIDYVRADESGLDAERSQLRRKKNWNHNFLTRSIYLALRQPESLIAQRKFRKNRASMLRLTRSYHALSELEQSPPHADVYLTGSDQVWGPVMDGSRDPAYYLSFTAPDARRVSYGASLGKGQLDEPQKEMFRHWLSRYARLTVRESGAVDLLGQLGLHAEQVLDPTLLLTRQEWEPLFASAPAGEYVLVYQIHNDPSVGRYARKVAEEMGLPLYRVSASFHQIIREGKFIYLPEPGKFLSLIANARCLITDSFHGTAFALNFHTPFVEVLPQNGTESRNVSILQLTGLESRILRDENDIAMVSQPVDFTGPNAILAEKRRESLEILKYMLEDTTASD